uniref:Protein kinase domain-containing protein n=1 Tax=Tetraselmis chuii TaxID=63592 RepID=A0A7S1X8N9_9CHLO|mmetsp:Transcript_39791/g.71423  ORF Transcript_39791/g.71423 Transcript_39791/m.71423 type:complete len:648 (+) Transcript_39791:307-2250(+)
MGSGQSAAKASPSVAPAPKVAQQAWAPAPSAKRELMPQGITHKPAPQPPSEDLRVDCLCKYNLLDSNREERFDDITKLISGIFKVPIALVSIVDTDRQWFKSVVGLPVRQTPRDQSFCAWTLVAHVAQVLVVPDAENDARFRNNPLVTSSPDIRFYCGSPIVTHTGHRMGSLCIIDRVRRNVSPAECMFLGNMADLVAREIEDPSGGMENSTPLMLVDMRSTSIVYVNSVFAKDTGIQKATAVGKSMYDMFKILSAEGKEQATKDEVYQAVAQGVEDFGLDVESDSGDGAVRYRLIFHAASSQQLFANSYIIGAPVSIAKVDSPVKEPAELSMMVFVKMERIEGGAAGTSDAQPLHFPTVPANLPPKELPVTIGAPIGKGSYGTVYRGTWEGKEVAVKVMPTEDVVAEEGYDPKKEAELTKKLTHPNLVTAHSHYVVDNPASGQHEIWLLLELCELGTLATGMVNGFFRKKEGNWALDIGRVLKVAYQVADVMAYVHSQGVIHSDLTTNNVLLTHDPDDDFTCKLSDFGVAQVLDPDEDSITTEQHGTVTHMPPELLMDCKLSKAADVYSFGVLLWELYHSQRPFEGMMHAQVIAQVALKNMRPEISEDCPEEYRAMIEDCWDAEDEERPTFEDIKSRLSKLIAQGW